MTVLASEMQLYSGGYLNLNNPRPEQINLIDIAHGLAHIARFGGQSLHFLSVAQHSIIVSRDCPYIFRVQALFHDAHEAYLGDLIYPLKMALGDEGLARYRVLEARLAACIAARFGYELPLADAVQRSDRRALLAEARWVMRNKGREWVPPDEPHAHIGSEAHEPPMAPQRARTAFLDRAQMVLPPELFKDLRT